MLMLTDADVMELWERGQQAPPLRRALLLLAAARPDLTPDERLDTEVDHRDAAILELRQATYGHLLPGWILCPDCGERLSFELDARALAETPRASPKTSQAGARLRRPTSRDLASVSQADDLEHAERLLLRRCRVEANPADEDGAFRDITETADPEGQDGLGFHCAACGAAWTEHFDIVAYFWEEVEQHVRQLQDEVHVLARGYGWSERDILALGPARRGAYLQRCLA